MKLGYASRHKMLSEMTIQECKDWQHYFQYEPLEEQRADWRSAMIVSTLRNIFRAKGAQAVHAKDFLLSFGPAKKKQTPEEQERIGYEWYLLSLQDQRES